MISGKGRYFVSPNRPDRFWDQSRLYPKGTEALYQGIKRPGREADLSAIKKAWINIHSLISLHGVLLISLLKHRDTFTSAVYDVYRFSRTFHYFVTRKPTQYLFTQP